MSFFIGKVTAASAATVTVTWSGTAPALAGATGREFHSTVGSWAIDSYGTINSAGTNAWASLTPTVSGELYVGFANTSAAATGSTTGYVYTSDTNNNQYAYNLNCAAGTPTAPAFSTSTQLNGVMVLVQETVSAPPMTVTATATAGGGGGALIRVTALTGAKPAAQQPGGVAGTASASSISFDTAITVAATGSVVYGAAANFSNATSFTADAQTTFSDNYSNSSSGDQLGTFRSTAATSATGSQTYGATNSASGATALAEILASGTIAEDASATSAEAQSNTATFIASPSFSPPYGSLLVARVVLQNGSTAMTCSITDTSGLGLTWTPLSQHSVANSNYAGVWIAQMPAGTAVAASLSAPVPAIPPGFRSPMAFQHIVPAAPLVPAPAGVLEQNTFEGGTSGTGISTGNSGGASGRAFDAVNTSGAGTTAQFSSAQAMHGTLSAALAFASGVSSTAYLTWSTSAGALPTVWFRLYVWHSAYPTVNTRLWQCDIGGSTLCASVYLMTNGTLLVGNTSSATITQSTTVVPNNAWYRIEGYVTGSAAAGQTELKIFTTPDGPLSSPAETNTSAATQNTGGVPSAYRYGSFAAVTETSAWTCYLDDIGLSGTGYLGPAGTGITGAAALTGTGTLTTTVVQQSAVALAGTGTLTQAEVQQPTATLAATDARGRPSRATCGTMSRHWRQPSGTRRHGHPVKSDSWRSGGCCW